ncbi:CHAT domain-containing protein [Mycena latifolia]|nr:CHAT domain-containing protein [Mycena latifolia]
MAFTDRYRSSGNLSDLEAALQNDRAAVKATPLDHPDLLKRMHNLGISLTDRYQRFGDLKDLEDAIQNKTKSMEITPANDPYLPKRMQSLALSLLDRYYRIGNYNDLETALQHHLDSVKMTPIGHPELPGRLGCLATTLTAKYERFGDIQDLEAVLMYKRAALSGTPEGHPELAQHMQSLALSLRDRFGRLGDIKDLDSALQLDQDALLEISDDDPDMFDYLASLTESFMNKYQRFGETRDLESALQNARAAVTATPDTHPHFPAVLQNLAHALTVRYDRFGDLHDLEESMIKKELAVNLTPKDHPDRFVHLESLAVSLIKRYTRLGDLKDLQNALSHEQAVVDATPRDDPDLSHRLYNLGESFQTLYHLLGNLGDLESSMQKFKAALAAISDDDPNYARYLQGLSACFNDRYHRFQDLKDLETALQLYQQAVAATPDDHLHMPHHLQNIAKIYIDRHKRLGDMNDLEWALENERAAITKISEDDPALSGHLNHLALCLSYRYLKLGIPEDLEAAIENSQTAIKIIPDDHPDLPGRLYNLAGLFKDRYNRTMDKNDLNAALKTNQDAVAGTPEGHPKLPAILQSLAVLQVNQYGITQDPAHLEAAFNAFSSSFKSIILEPESCWEAAIEWAQLAELMNSSDCIKAYSVAFSLLPDVLWIGHTLHAHHDATSRIDIAGTVSDAISACIDFGDLFLAIKFLEQGLATTFQQLLELRADLKVLAKDDADKLHWLSTQLYGKTSDDLKGTAIERDNLLKKIRNKPGLEYFLFPKPYEHLCNAARNGPIIILNSNVNHCDAIILLNPTSDPLHIPLPTVTLDALESQRFVLREVLGWANISTRTSQSTRLFGRQERFTSKSSDECFGDLLEWLWCNIIEKIYKVLEYHQILDGRLWWCPTGAFTSLPLHAAAPTDKFIQSYTSTLSALLEASSKQPAMCQPTVGVIGVTYSGPNRHANLPAVAQEIKKIVGIVGQENVRTIISEQATPDSVKSQLQDCPWIHLACHAKQDLDDPPKSYLRLYGGNLELETILKSPLPNAEFVFLSACQTAMGDAQLTNESFHLAGGLITAGFRGAIATMWSILDSDGPVVAEAVYTNLFGNGRQPQAADAAKALQGAVRKMRDNGVAYERWLPFIHIGV